MRVRVRKDCGLWRLVLMSQQRISELSIERNENKTPRSSAGEFQLIEHGLHFAESVLVGGAPGGRDSLC